MNNEVNRSTQLSPSEAMHSRLFREGTESDRQAFLDSVRVTDAHYALLAQALGQQEISEEYKALLRDSLEFVKSTNSFFGRLAHVYQSDSTFVIDLLIEAGSWGQGMVGTRVDLPRPTRQQTLLYQQPIVLGEHQLLVREISLRPSDGGSMPWGGWEFVT